MAVLSLPSTEETIGPLIIGFSITCGIFGILSQQTLTYYRRYTQDRLIYKSLVGLLWINQFLYVVFVGLATYFYTVTHHGDVVFFLTKPVFWSLIIQVVQATMSSTVVKIVFMLRVWTFSQKNMWITGLIFAMIISQASLATVYTVGAFRLRVLARAHELTVIATASLAVGVATDFVVAAALCYFLHKLKTGFSSSDSLVTRLSTYAINTGIVTSVISASTLGLYNMYPDALYFMGSYFVLGNLYAISFICTLNTRCVIRGQGVDSANSGSSPTSESGQRNAIVMLTNPRQGHGHKGSTATNRVCGPLSSHVSKDVEENSIQDFVQIGVRHEIYPDLEANRDPFNRKGSKLDRLEANRKSFLPPLT